MSIKIMGEKYGLGQAKGGRFDSLFFKHDHIHILTITSLDGTQTEHWYACPLDVFLIVCLREKIR